MSQYGDSAGNVVASYHLERVHAHTPAYYPSWMHFCNWYLNQTILQADFVNCALFIDEACFTRERNYNSRNSHIWSMENPRPTIVRSHQHRFFVNVWAGDLDDFLLGPYILPEWLNANTYLIFLQTFLPELLRPIPLNIRRSMRLQHDGHHLNLTMQYVAIWQLHWALVGLVGVGPLPGRHALLTWPA